MTVEVDRQTLKPKIPKSAIVKELWKRKNLRFILRPHQLPIYEFFHSNDQNQLWNIARQTGKSTSLCLLAVEHCILFPGHFVRFFAPSTKQAREIVEQNMPVILETCPQDMLPVYLRNRNKYVFPNGSTITLQGVDAADGKGLRGGSTHLAILDEAAFMANLPWIIDSVIMPMFLNTNGRYIMSSTPPPTLAHPWVGYVEEHQRRGTYLCRTFDDNTWLSPEKRERIEFDQSIIGPEGEILIPARERDSFKREYLCQLINDSDHLIVPEWQAVKDLAVEERERPTHFVPFVSADWGVKDYDAILFGYVDFREQLLVIEDEVLVNYQAPSDTAMDIKKKLNELWPGHPHGLIKFFSDTEWDKIMEIRKVTGINFRPALKYDLDVAIAGLRTKISQCGVRINPKCQNLLRQLDMGVWEVDQKGKKKDFKRTEKLGHCDLLSALIYMHRMADYRTNPYPVGSSPTVTTHHIPAQVQRPANSGIEGLFARKR
ncbi:terminase large subunit domain-containing protein [Azospirillum sp. sgz301742]